MRRIRGRELVTAAALGGVVCVLGACNKTPLASDGHRSQFDRYDQTRNNFAAPFVMDEFGRRQPNLRGRLLEKD